MTRRVTASTSIAGVFGWPPTCAYADMSRLKSNDAIQPREVMPRNRVVASRAHASACAISRDHRCLAAQVKACALRLR
jgi:hypothetical protein